MNKPSGNPMNPTSPLKGTVAHIAPPAPLRPTVSAAGIAGVSGVADSMGPAVLAQPPVPGSEGVGGHLHPVRSEPSDPAAMPSFDDVRRLFSDARDVVKSRYRDAYEMTDDRLHKTPWQGVLIAALAGVLLGMLASR